MFKNLMVQKFLTILLAGILLVMPVIVNGCINTTGNTTTTTSKEISAQDISAAVILNYANINSYKMNMDMTMTMDMNMSGQQMNGSMSGNSIGEVQLTTKELHMLMNMTVNIPMQGTQNLVEEIYIAGGQMYVKGSGTGITENTWTKMPVTEQEWQSQDGIAQDIEFLKSAVEITKLADETVDGVACYVLQIKPDMAAVGEWMMSQQESMTSGLDYSKLDFNKIFKNVLLKVWVAKNSYLPVKDDVSLTMELAPEDVGAPAGSTGKISMTITGTERYTDYNKPVTIQLPAEALNAKTMTP